MAAGGDGLRMRYRFSTASLPVAERLPYWRDVICPEFYSLTPSGRPDATTFAAWHDVRDAGRFGFAQSGASDHERSRSAGDIARDSTDYVTLYRAERGSQNFDFGATEMTLGAGDMCIISTTQRFTVRSRDGQALQTLVVPAAFLAPLVAGGAPQRPLSVRSSSPIGALLGASLNAAWEQIPQVSDELGDAILANLAGLVAVACGASEDGTAIARQGAGRIRSDLILCHIERHLADPELTPDQAARALGMSERQIHTVLEPTGETFTRHVMRRRLEACRLALENPAFSNRSVTDIALGWGFNSMSTFYRAFRAAYGFAPRDLETVSSSK